jgi:hypothetical protein
MAMEKLRINYKAQKIKPGPTHILRTIKKEPLTQSDQTTDRTQNSVTHIVIVLNTTNTICGENYESSWVQASV